MTDRPDDHEHRYPEGSSPEGTVVFCLDCAAWQVSTGAGLREPTAQERVTVVARMMEDVAYAQALQIIHGREEGLARLRRLRGYDQ